LVERKDLELRIDSDVSLDVELEKSRDVWEARMIEKSVGGFVAHESRGERRTLCVKVRQRVRELRFPRRLLLLKVDLLCNVLLLDEGALGSLSVHDPVDGSASILLQLSERVPGFLRLDFDGSSRLREDGRERGLDGFDDFEEGSGSNGVEVVL